MAGEFNPFAGMPNYTGYERPEGPRPYIEHHEYTDEQLAFIFTAPEVYGMEDYAAAVAMDFLSRAVDASSLAEFLAYRRAYRSLNQVLIHADYWPEE